MPDPETSFESPPTLEEALLQLGPELDRYAADSTAEFRDEPPDPGVGERLLKRHFASPETVVVVARSREGALRGYCVTVPFEDPLVGDAVPLIVALYVEPRKRHLGLATSLVAEVSAVLAARGIQALSARAGHTDDALISMGERWGFVRSWEFLVRE